MVHLCTYFDRHYLPLGLALYSSLKKRCPAFRLYILCLDEEVRSHLAATRLPEVVLVDVPELERYLPALLEAKANRTVVEYYFTLSPVLPLYLMATYPDIDVLSYADSDLYLYGDLSPLIQELGSGSVMLLAHWFEGPNPKHDLRGHYNVGYLAFRNDERAKTCLRWWRDRCLEWCRDRSEDGKYADQKYLDDLPRRFEGVVVSENRGALLGPWNVQIRNPLRSTRSGYACEQSPLIFFHFHSFRIIRSWLVDCGVTYSGLKWNRTLLNIYRSYAVEVLQSMRSGDCGRWAGRDLRYDRGGLKLIDYLLTRRVYARLGPFNVTIYLAPVTRVLLRVRDVLLGRGGRAAS